MTGQSGQNNAVFDDLKTRSIVGVGLALVTFLFVWLGGVPFAAFMALISALMLAEFTRMVRPECHLEDAPRLIMIALGSISVLALGFSGVWFTAIASIGLLLAATLNQSVLGRQTVVGYAAIVMGAGAAVHLRDFTTGFPLVVWIILCVAAADIGGYMFGRMLQGPKLLPSISPKKTWSGFLGGMGLSVIVALIFAGFSGGSLGTMVLFGILISVVSVAGDLIESSLKRRYGVKDAGTILPGHGGVMDRLDGMTAAMLLIAALSFLVDLSALVAPDYAKLLSGVT